MNKLVSFNNVKKVILTSCLLALPSLGFSGEVLDPQDEYLLELLEEKKSEMADEYYYSNDNITAKSKQGADAIMGTWLVSYTYNGAHTDKIALDKVHTFSDGEIAATGTYYPNNSGSGTDLLCMDYDSGPKYTCLSEVSSSKYVVFYLDINGSNINGHFGTGSSDSAFTMVKSSQYPVTGSREGTGDSGSECNKANPFDVCPDQPPVNNSEATYNDVKHEIDIPVLNYKGNKYKLILKNKGNSMFELTEVSPI